MQSLNSGFFLDHSAMVRVGKRTMEEAKGHLTLLLDDVDCNLSVAALLDGNTIDFLFGFRDNDARSVVAKANNAKKFMRGLDTDGQEAFAKFYLVVFQSLTRYHKAISHPCSCLWARSLNVQLREDIEEAFAHLRGIVTEKNVLLDQ